VYRQVFDPVAHSLGWSSLVAALPLLLLFVLLGGLRVQAWLASLASLVLAFVLAGAVWGMPWSQAALAGSEGAFFGLFAIVWILVNAIWLYNMTDSTGHAAVLRRSFAGVSDDERVQAIIIAFCFGALIEALAGFGTPVLLSAAMLVAIGMRPLLAATVSLVANTAPVAFGAIAVPITTLSAVTGLPVHDLGSMVGRQTPVLAAFVPFGLLAIVDGARGLREAWPAALAAGVGFGAAQFVASNYISVQLTDIIASLFSAACVVALVRVWRPGARAVAARPAATGPPRIAGGASDDLNEAEAVLGGTRAARTGGPPDAPVEVARAYAPYLIVVAVFAIAQIGAVKRLLEKPTRKFAWPGLHIVGANGKSPSSVTFMFNFLTIAGTLLLIAGLLSLLVLRIRPAAALAIYGKTLYTLRFAIITIILVLALAYVLNLSAMTITIGRWAASAGGAFAIISPILGWLGVAVTGSDTSSNALFGALQITAAKGAGLPQTLIAAANSSGGVLGKMISPQNLAVASAAIGISGKEGDIFRRVVGWSLLFLALMCLLVWLQSTPALSWMVV
jgi:lactate permease